MAMKTHPATSMHGLMASAGLLPNVAPLPGSSEFAAPERARRRIAGTLSLRRSDVHNPASKKDP
jgi:hypothetical protein